MIISNTLFYGAITFTATVALFALLAYYYDIIHDHIIITVLIILGTMLTICVAGYINMFTGSKTALSIALGALLAFTVEVVIVIMLPDN